MNKRRRWEIAERAPEAFFRSLSSYPPQMLQVLWNRGVRDRDAVGAFLSPGLAQLPDPYRYKDMDRAIDRLAFARRKRERVLIYGDFDPDGACAAAVLADTLQALRVRHSVYLPDRVAEGHGLSPQGVVAAAERGARLVITVDCGVTNVDEIAALREKGIEVIVLDHHLPPKALPEAVAVIDAQRPDDEYPFDWLCGAGVAFAFADAAARAPIGSTLPSDFLSSLTDLVAIATVADLVPLRDANRALVARGLLQLKETPRVGLRALMAVSRVDPPAVREDDIAFELSPRLNAASRMDHANTAYALLTAKTAREGERLAKTLDRHNRARQRRVAEILAEVETDLRETDRVPDVIIAAGKGWSSTVISGVATKLAERANRPAFVFEVRNGRAVGSGRSVPGFDLVAALRACGGEDALETFGGHAMAAGCTIREEWLPLFRERMEAYARVNLAPEELTPEISVDLEIRAHEPTPELLSWFNRLAPFGKENPRPRLLLRNLEAMEVRAVGRRGNGRKLRLVDRGTGRVVNAIDRTDALPDARAGDRLDIVGELRADAWRGRGEVTIRIVDMRPHTNEQS